MKQSHRGRGVGNQLIEKAVQILRKIDLIKKVKLAVNSEQSAAIDLYKKFGFSVSGMLKKELFYKNKYYDELIMELLF